MKKSLILVVFLMLIGSIKTTYAQTETQEAPSVATNTAKNSKGHKKEYYSEYSRWSVGAEFGLPFFSGDVSSLAAAKTYYGLQLMAHVGYQFNPFFGVKLSGSFGKNKAGAKSYALDYILGPDAMTYYPPTTIQGVKYSDIYSDISFFNLGLHFSLNMNNLVNMNNPNRLLTVLLEPAIYMQSFSPNIKTSVGETPAIKKINRSLNLGLGGDLVFRFHLSRLLDLQLGGGITYIADNKFDGIQTVALAHDSYMWNVKAGIVFKLNNKKHKNNILYAAPYRADLDRDAINEALNDATRKLRQAENDLADLRASKPDVIVEERIVEKIVEKEVIKEAPSFPSVYFKRGSAFLEADLYARELDEIMSMLKEYPEANVITTGYTDHTGSVDLNLELAEKRAKALRDFIVEKGVDAERISIHGYGKDTYTAGQNQYNVLARRASLEFKK